jgi:hypothetical protein
MVLLDSRCPCRSMYKYCKRTSQEMTLEERFTILVPLYDRIKLWRQFRYHVLISEPYSVYSNQCTSMPRQAYCNRRFGTVCSYVLIIQITQKSGCISEGFLKHGARWIGWEANRGKWGRKFAIVWSRCRTQIQNHTLVALDQTTK